MKQDIDTRHGERLVHDGYIKFYNEIYKHSALEKWVGYQVIVKGFGYNAVDVYLVERKTKSRWGKGEFLCMIESNSKEIIE